MITCNRCGSINPVGAGNCQTCGVPLSSKNGNEQNPRAGGIQGPPAEIPAWLESLRVGERPAAPLNSAANFSAADLIEEGTLPSWMRSERSAADEPAARGSLRSSSLPGPATDEAGQQGRGINARSLIDEQALPSWMQEAKGNREGAALPQRGIEASALVQPDALPDWMRNMQQPSSPSAHQVQPSQSTYPPVSAPPVQSTTATPFEEPRKFTEPIQFGSGFSASQLIDQQSLPAWMTQQGGQGNAASAGPVGGQGGQPGQGGFSASSLLDADAIPPWLQQGAQEQRGNATSPSQPMAAGQPGQPAQPFAQSPSAPTAQSWQAPSSMPVQPSPVNGAPGNAAPGGGLSASSFIDVNALPEWLRNADDPSRGVGSQQQRGPIGNARPGAYGPPARVENMRVPSRPRAEVNPSEGSEVAANVFASMLGVASAPKFPTQSANPPQPAQPYGQYPAPQNMPPAGASPQGFPPQNMLPQGGLPPQPGPGYAFGAQGGYPPQNGALNNYYATGAPQMAGPQMPANAPMMSPMSRGTEAGRDPKAEARPAKRSIFNAIREWLGR